MFRDSIGKLHRVLGRSHTIARLARNVRNKANAISSAYCAEVEGANSESNKWRYNEFALID